MWLDALQGSRQPGEEICERIRKSGKPVAIYGAGAFARKVTETLNSHGIDVAIYAVDEEFFHEGKTFLGKPIWNFDKLTQNVHGGGTEFEFVLGMSSIASLPSLHKFMEIKEATKHILAFPYFGIISLDWIKEHFAPLDQTYHWLEDDLSRKTFRAFWKLAISSNPDENFKIWQHSQYFNEITATHNKDVFVDCGAFCGDTAEEFIHWTKGNYYKIYAIEPDPKNCTALKDLIKKNQYPNVEIIPFGVWNEQTTLTFSSGAGSSSAVMTEGDICIEVDTIDHILNGNPASLLKMDLEGSELMALHGAERTIRQSRPALAICVYHRPEDLITIPQYIKSFDTANRRYHLFLREHHWDGSELVLYAIPENV